MATILIADDDADVVELIRHSLAACGHRAVTVAETAAGVAVGVGIAYGLFKAGEYFFSGE